MVHMSRLFVKSATANPGIRDRATTQAVLHAAEFVVRAPGDIEPRE